MWTTFHLTYWKRYIITKMEEGIKAIKSLASGVLILFKKNIFNVRVDVYFYSFVITKLRWMIVTH